MNNHASPIGETSSSIGALTGESTGRVAAHQLPLLVIVEGRNDIAFLRRISAVLSTADDALPNLSALERRGALIFVPSGGEIEKWALRMAPLGKAEVHVYDQEVPPLSEARYYAARIVNLRPACRAFVTRKRNLENYLHADAIFQASGIEIEFGDDADVADLVARNRFLVADPSRDWLSISARCRRRLRNHVKQWLNRDAVDRMTSALLDERDPNGEIRSWLAAIGQLTGSLT